MKIKTAVGAALLASAISSLPASAAGNTGTTYVARPSQNMVMPRLAGRTAGVMPVQVARRVDKLQADDASAFTTAYGDTLPPVGFVNFCVDHNSECQDYSWGEKLTPQKLDITAERWQQIYQVNTFINNNIKPVSDQALYGKPEVWAYPQSQGDCEDYALLKKRTLQHLGVPAKLLQITVVLDENNEGHAVLTLASDMGDFVLDNRRDDIRLWNDTNYTFLKRQSAWNPRQWVALQNTSDTAAMVASAQQ